MSTKLSEILFGHAKACNTVGNIFRNISGRTHEAYQLEGMRDAFELAGSKAYEKEQQDTYDANEKERATRVKDL